MRPHFITLIWLLNLVLPLRAADSVDYLRDIKPIFAVHCIECHGPMKQRSGLRLDTRANILKGGNSGAVVVAGQSGTSRLILAVTSQGNVKSMPPKGSRLSAEKIRLLKTWIDAGLPGPAQEVAASVTNPSSKHWAFQAPKRPVIPLVLNGGWPGNPIDRFILTRLERENIRPSPEADRVTLIRRLSLDLLGLPPTVAEVEQFLSDLKPGAYERLVDRLLASPHFGERWGRHWLDLARYADSNGYSIDAPRSIWKYRDWVVEALNRDLPFDEFTVEQIAGDMLPGAGQNERIATGFHRNTPFNEEGGIDLEQFRVESIVDRVNTTGSVFLGLTIGCAQCHDHKFDPISQREYYQLFAFFNSADEPVMEVPTPQQEQQRQRIRRQIAVLEKQLHRLDPTTNAKQVAWENSLSTEAKNKLPGPIRVIIYIPPHQRTDKQHHTLAEAFRNADRVRHAIGGLGSPSNLLAAAHANAALARASLEKQIGRLRRTEPKIPTTLVMRERAEPRKTNVHLGGDFIRKGAEVSPTVLAVLSPLDVASPNRLDLARWLVRPENPLTARVTMNRIWQHYFGLGLVETENDFGTQGTPPSHPELLDWLATELVARKMSLKEMHRLIVTSATYRQASRARPELATVDPRNRLLARQARLRLDAEIVRDVALASSGLLIAKLGGPTIYPPQPDGVYRFTQVVRDWKESTGPERFRRGLYITFWRSAAHPALMVFDAPNAVAACTRRIRSNTPLQALTLLNDQAFIEFAQQLAARVLREAPNNDTGRIRLAFQLCLSRAPRASETERLTQLLQEQRSDLECQPTTQSREQAAFSTVARVLLNLDEFITRE